MEISLRLSQLVQTGVVLGLSCALGCASARKSGTQGTFAKPPEAQTESTSRAIPGTLEGQEKVEELPQREVHIRPIVLVLGPGLAKGFAYAGVFEALAEAKIPIAAIFGTEMGALIGALYAVNPQINAFDWSIFQLKEELFKEPSSFFGRFKSESSEGKKFEEYLKQVFGNRKIQDAVIPLRIAVQSKDMGIPFVLEQGNLSEVVRAAMASPRVFSATALESHGDSTLLVAATPTRPFLVTEAKKLDLGPVIVINTLSKNETLGAKDELKEADLVLTVDTQGIGYFDYSKKATTSYKGKEVVLHALPIIRHLMETVTEPEIGEGYPEQQESEKAKNL